MNYFLAIFPTELQAAPSLICGFLTLVGLILCTAGVKVARPMAAALVGAATATFTACVLPPICGLDPWISAIIGLALGLMIGAVAFRLVQGILLALCLSVLATSAFYQWETRVHPVPPAKAISLQLPADSAAAKIFPSLPPNFQHNIQSAYTGWYGIPLSLRQSLIVIGLGVGVLAAIIAWMAPRQTTWTMSATVGAIIMLYGIFTLMNTYLPQLAYRIPARTLPRLVILVFIVAAGMLVQRLYFWPEKGKAKNKTKSKSRPGEPAAA